MESNRKSNHSDRSANFDEEEVKLLVHLLIRYKSIILNKNTNSNSNLAKEKAWRKITKLFNKEKLNVYRSSDHLKTKWLNLKREAKRVQNNSPSELSDTIKEVVQLSYESINDNKLQAEIMELNDDSESDEEFLNENTNEKVLNNDRGSKSHSDTDEEKPLKKERKEDFRYKTSSGVVRKKSMNFSAQECSLLLKLVKEEKHNLFMPGLTKEIVRKKYLAWERIAKRYNATSCKKRPLRVLKTKFENMKRRNRDNIRSRSSNLEQDGERDPCVKKEPSMEYDDENEFNHLVDEDSEMNGRTSSPLINNDNMDPLRFVLNTDSGLGSTSMSLCHNETDLIKLKMELLNYQLETAKLERQRVEDAMKADKEEQESRAIENSLRLRTERLKALAAERQFNENDRALLFYNEQEVLGMEYIKMSTNDT